LSDISKIHSFVIMTTPPFSRERVRLPCGRASSYVEAAFKERRQNEEVYVEWEGRLFRVNRP
jgi:hypothetical protein